MFRYGDVVKIVSNPSGKNSSAFKKFRAGKDIKYEVWYYDKGRNYVSCREVDITKYNGTKSYTWYFDLKEVILSRHEGVELENYL